MRVRSLGALLLTAGLAASLSGTPAARAIVTGTDAGAAPSALGLVAFGPGDVLFAADPRAAAIYAFDLGSAKPVLPAPPTSPNLDKKLAAVLGTDAAQVTITDLAVHPTTRNVYLAAMRGTGAGAAPALVRLDGAGRLDVVALGGLKSSSLALPNAPVANPPARRDPRRIDHRHGLRERPADRGRPVERGVRLEAARGEVSVVAGRPRHQRRDLPRRPRGVETRSPVYAFVPYTIGGTKQIVAGYLCTPLVTFPMASLTAAPGTKVRGTTIAELGNGNRPIDMIVYSRGGQDYLLMANTSRGVMNIPTATFASARGINAKVVETTAGVPFETLADSRA